MLELFPVSAVSSIFLVPLFVGFIAVRHVLLGQGIFYYNISKTVPFFICVTIVLELQNIFEESVSFNLMRNSPCRHRTRFVATFKDFIQLWVLQLQTYIALSNLHSEYVEFSHYVRYLLPLKSFIKEVIDSLGMNSDMMKFVSI